MRAGSNAESVRSFGVLKLATRGRGERGENRSDERGGETFHPSVKSKGERGVGRMQLPSGVALKEVLHKPRKNFTTSGSTCLSIATRERLEKKSLNIHSIKRLPRAGDSE